MGEKINQTPYLHFINFGMKSPSFLQTMEKVAAAAANEEESLPILYERKAVKNTLSRIIEVTILFLLFSLLSYRILSLQNHGFIWVFAFVCELWFTFTWFLIMNCKWSLIKYFTYPQNLLQRYGLFCL